ncbi:Transcription factor TFIid complex subunit 8 C-term-like protein [Elsinoe fawcettii]|nr:Transcription factor TFIid complex subunit 8 C-term-like protein [Elsinoe fawcettii]
MSASNGDVEQRSSKRQCTDGGGHHVLHFKQEIPPSTEPAAQDPTIMQRQFDKGVTAALALAGFDSVTASALHSLEAMAEEFITDLLESTCLSMVTARRTTPIPQDVAFALSQVGIAPSQLEDQLTMSIPKDIACPVLPSPPPEEPAPIDLKPVLGAELCEPPQQRTYPQIPTHFPPLPSKHAWRQTPYIAAREKDPRKIRERATQEGILAEKSLRKLAAAASKPRSMAQRTASKREKEKVALWQDALACLMADQSSTSQTDGDADAMMDGTNDAKDKVKALLEQDDRAAMVVNYDRAHWRKGASFGSVRS